MLALVGFTEMDVSVLAGGALFEGLPPQPGLVITSERTTKETGRESK
jgi:hypothetical protein